MRAACIDTPPVETVKRWSEGQIAAALARQTFNSKYLVVVPNCNWPGNECDLLAITENLRVIDIEIKISRADLKADAKKDKWFHHWDWRIDGPRDSRGDRQRRPREWPLKTWKHYYAMPADIWKDDLLSCLPSPASGVLLLHATRCGSVRGRESPVRIECVKMAKPCRDAKPISSEDAIDIARLASLRMWDALSRAK